MLRKKSVEVFEDNEEKNPLIQEVVEYIVWLAAVILAVQFLTRYVGVFSVVDGASMEPTLYHQEYLWVDKVEYHLSDPERFDVIIFPVMYDGEEKHYVKRIIGLPGEMVQIDEKGVIYINGEVLQEGYGKEVISYYNRFRAEQPITLGEDEYFVLGDNRNNSSDSRTSIVGNVKREDIVGRVAFCLWPFDKIGVIK